MAGDVGIMPKFMGYYVGTFSDIEEVEMLEVYKVPKTEGFSLEQWLKETSKKTIAEHILKTGPKVGNAFADSLSAERQVVKPKLSGWKCH